MSKNIDALWTVEDLAEYLAIPVQDVQEMSRHKSIPHVRLGERLRFRRPEIDRWLDGLAVPCLDRASRPLASPKANSEGSMGRRTLPPSALPPVLPTVPQTHVLSAPSSFLPLPGPTKTRRAVPACFDDAGPDDRHLQKLVQEIGEKNGFRVAVNQMVPSGHTSVDVALERDGWRLACEISVTSNLEQEIASIRKCLDSGFHEVAMVLPIERQARKLENALSNALTMEERARVRLLRPEEISGYIEGIMTVVCEHETTVGKYKVKVKYVRLNPAETARRCRALAEVLTRVFRS
ncbi:MAG TPA: helix-turn-helix domain-containing protein [Thermoanaerobaculia bacterium]|jgi:excisionase family DNA binding protein|nr:helix-turn-helix domain-containing protein [Thermoanaerobaculia bacterium]